MILSFHSENGTAGFSRINSRAKAILVELDSSAGPAVGSFSTDQVAEVEQSLTTLKQSAEAACTYLQNALKILAKNWPGSSADKRRTGPINSLWGWFYRRSFVDRK